MLDDEGYNTLIDLCNGTYTTARRFCRHAYSFYDILAVMDSCVHYSDSPGDRDVLV